MDEVTSSFDAIDAEWGPGAADDARAEFAALRQAALELHAEIRSALAWIATGAEPSVAHSALLKTADKWLPLLEKL